MRLVAPAVAIVLSCAACAGHEQLDRDVSKGDPTSVRVDEVPVKGFTATVTTSDRTLSGELLAVEADHLYLLDDGKTLDIPTREVVKVTVDLYPAYGDWIAVWTVAGTISTISHGRWLLITAPIWLLVGIPTAAVTYSSNPGSATAHLPGETVQLWQFARFPAGLPQGWPRASRQ
jgi:hypothetical protein